jgi:hypothetical protein
MPTFSSRVNGARANPTLAWFSWLAMIYVVSMILRWTVSLCGSHKRRAQNLLGYFFRPEVHIELINLPCQQLTAPGVEYIVCVEVRRCIVLNADAMIHNLPEVMTTRISQKLSLVTSALIRSGNKGDNPLTCSSVVGFQKISSFYNHDFGISLLSRPDVDTSFQTMTCSL